NNAYPQWDFLITFVLYFCAAFVDLSIFDLFELDGSLRKYQVYDFGHEN
ncbi:14678_t:CDS:1, partial [Funneliformis geosporum]